MRYAVRACHGTFWKRRRLSVAGAIAITVPAIGAIFLVNVTLGYGWPSWIAVAAIVVATFVAVWWIASREEARRHPS